MFQLANKKLVEKTIFLFKKKLNYLSTKEDLLVKF
jgi:hypothetical protein